MLGLIDATAGGGREERRDSRHPWGLEAPPTKELTSCQVEPQRTGLAVAVFASSPLLCCLEQGLCG